MAGPMYNAYTVHKYKSGREEKTYWHKIGAVFPHKNGTGFDIVLKSLPLGDRIVCREPLKDEPADELAEAPAAE